MHRTLVICKPDAVERGLVGEIISRIEARSLRVVAAELRTIDKDLAAEHYGEHRGKPFYEDLLTFITRGPSLLLVVEGPRDTPALVRAMMGSTDAATAAPGTIRGDFAVSNTENLVHGSDSPEAAAREIARFFPDLVSGGPGA